MTLEPTWGTHAPRGLLAWVLSRTHNLPATATGGRVGRTLRRLARLGRAGRPVDVELWGLKLRLHSRGNVSEARLLFMPKLWEPGERALLRERARPGFVFLDVGANAGGYSLWVLGLLGDACRIVAVEPDPELHRRLTFNARTNAAENLRVLRVAAGDREGEGRLLLDLDNRGENRIVAGAGPGLASGGSAVVPLRTLHSIVQDERLSRIDALKIDIEGLELQVLNTFFRMAHPVLWPRLIIVEHHGTPDHIRLQEQLHVLGYRVVLRTGLNRILEREGKARDMVHDPAPRRKGIADPKALSMEEAG